jgi:GxxExxY protein
LKRFTTEDTEGTERNKMLRDEDLTHRIIGAAIEVHKQLGPGLLESTYERCLRFELQGRGIVCRTQVELPVVYRGIKLDCGYRVDVLVEERVVVELKAVEKLTPIDEAQLLTYLRLGGFETGLLINFNVLPLRDGIVRRVL